jgi:hypothetical protein
VEWAIFHLSPRPPTLARDAMEILPHEFLQFTWALLDGGIIMAPHMGI